MEKAMIGYQIYSARDDAAADLTGTLRAVKEMGYDGIELAGFYGKTPKEWKAALDEVGLRAISSHVSFDLIEADPYKVVSDHKLLGCEYIAVPYLGGDKRPGMIGFAETIRQIRRFGELCKGAGIQLLYHNHDFEFCMVSGMYGLDFLYAAICPCALQTEIDTCWVKYAGLDPAEYVRKYAGRCPVVHLKDFIGGKKGCGAPYALIRADGKAEGGDQNVQFEFRPVGHGCQDVRSIVTAGLESGAKWFIVEQDDSPARPPLEAARMSRDFLKSIGQ